MKRLLRGVIDWGGISREGLITNHQKVRAAKLDWIQAPDRKIFKFVSDFFSRQMDLPSSKLVIEFFNSIDDIESVERLKDIADAVAYEGPNFSHVLQTLLEEQHRTSLFAALKQTQEIAHKGLVIGEGKEKERLEGVKDAVLFFQRKTAELLVVDNDAKTRGNLRAEAPAAWADYQKAHAFPDKAVGKLIGIPEIDTVCKGAKPGELWLHAAYSGELKTLTGLNWCYQLVTRYQTNVLFVSLEMPLKQLRNIVCVMHSTHPKWLPHGYKPLEYRRVRDGGLTPEEEAFYKIVLDDFEMNPAYGQFEVWTPDHEVTMADIKLTAEFLAKQIDLGFVVIDHGGIVSPVDKHKDFNIALNSVIRDAKKLALHFNSGVGVAVLLLFQINREGKDHADKNDGRYKLRALSHANEAERSADVVTTSYLDDQLRSAGHARYCNLKNRDNPMFEPMLIGIDFATRRLLQFIDGAAGMTSGPGADEATEEILRRV